MHDEIDYTGSPSDCNPDTVLEVKGGFYTFRDPLFVYVNRQLDEVTQAEVRAHETFHRHSLSSTVYGLILFIIDHLVRNNPAELDKDPETKDAILRFRKGLFKHTYIVQEGGALARTYAVLGFLHRVTSASELLRVQERFFDRLVPSYRSIATLYIEHGLKGLYSRRFKTLPPQLVYYTNEAVSAFCMNALYFHKTTQLDLRPDTSEVFSENVSPDYRLFKVMRRLLEPKSNDEFLNLFSEAVRRIYGIDDLSSPDAASVLQAASQEDDLFEHRFGGLIDACIHPVFPEFALPQYDFVYLTVAMQWKDSLIELFKAEVPNYVPPKIGMVFDPKVKQEIQKTMEKGFMNDKS